MLATVWLPLILDYFESFTLPVIQSLVQHLKMKDLGRRSSKCRLELQILSARSFEAVPTSLLVILHLVSVCCAFVDPVPLTSSLPIHF